MKHHHTLNVLSFAGLVALFALAPAAAGCGGTGPTQAEGPKPNLDKEPANTAGSGVAAKEDPGVDDARASLEAKDFAAARTKATAVLAKSPKSAGAHYVLGVCDEIDKKGDEAVKHYKAALEADPKMLEASINLSGYLVAESKQYDEAAEVARAGLKFAKGAVELHINLAYALKGKGDHATAAKAFANVVKMKPNDAVIYLDYAEELREAKDNDGAQKAYKQAVANAGGDTAVMAVAAMGLAQSGDYPGCVAAFDQAIAKKNSSDYLTERAVCKHKAGDLAGARADLDASIKEKPSIKAHGFAGKYAEEAKDKKACKAHWTEVQKMAAGTKIEEEAKKGLERCK